MARTHGAAYRFVDDETLQSRNGLQRDNISLRAYGTFINQDFGKLTMEIDVSDSMSPTLVFPDGQSDSSNSSNESNAPLNTDGSSTEPIPGASADMAAIANDTMLYSKILSTSNQTLPGNQSLEAIGAGMTSSNAGGGGSGIPAVYTYFGQFLAHDITHMQWDPILGAWKNTRGHSLNLDTLFDSATDCGMPSSTFDCRGGVCLGQTLPPMFGHRDLPRSIDGAPCILDARNDNNLAVSQIYVAMAVFHHAVVTAYPANAAEQRKITRQHIQSIVLHDFLQKLIDPQVYASVLAHGRKIIAPAPISGGPFLVPVEFAVACYRFGHSMVRNTYDPWMVGPRHLDNLLHYAYNTEGTGDGLVNGRQPLTWIQDWSTMTEVNPLTGAPPVESSPIDLNLADELGKLDDRYFEVKPGAALPGSTNLASQTLRRGFELGLPTAQELALAMSGPLAGMAGAQILTGPEIAQTTNPTVGLLMQAEGYDVATPLWLYTLREAEEVAANGGRGLGSIASRIVMETFHACIEAAQDSIIKGYDTKGKPEYDFTRKMAITTGPANSFTLAELLAIARPSANPGGRI